MPIVIIDMDTLFYILIATTVVSLGSLIGVVTLSLNQNLLNKILKLLIALSAGTMLATVFLHILPEVAEMTEEPHDYLMLTMLSFVLFFFIEKVLHWRHCHDSSCEDHHHFGTMNLIGDAIHNFIDGLLIAGAFMVSPAVGIPTTIAIAMHEIPQEIGDFAVLLYSGFTKNKAIFLNILISFTAVIGGVVGYYLIDINQTLTMYLLPIAAGGFLYIATSDLIPELRQEKSSSRVLATFTTFILGIALIWIMSVFHVHE